MGLFMLYLMTLLVLHCVWCQNRLSGKCGRKWLWPFWGIILAFSCRYWGTPL